MRVIYSVGVRFGGAGIGSIAYHGVQGLHRHDMLARLLCGSHTSTDIPSHLVRSLGLPSRALRKLASLEGSKRLQRWHSVLYDQWASRNLVPADLMLAWGADGLRSLERARDMGLMTVVEVATVHPAFRVPLMADENDRWGIRGQRWPGGLRRTTEEIALCDHVLIPSDFVRQTFLGQGVPADKLLQVPFGVDPLRFRPAERSESHPFRILFVGRIELGKGIPYLLEAWKRLSWRDAELVLVGPQEPAYVRLLREQIKGIDNQSLVGFVADPVPHYQSADLFVFPTLHEGSALVTYEALACGLPVITTENAGSVVRDGQEGFLVPIRSVDALASAMERLRQDGVVRRAMGDAARRRAKAFTWLASGDALAQTLSALAPGAWKG